MRIRQKTDISQIQEIDYLGSESCSGQLVTQLMARIARRPGRWRRRMQTRIDREEDHWTNLNEAA